MRSAMAPRIGIALSADSYEAADIKRVGRRPKWRRRRQAEADTMRVLDDFAGMPDAVICGKSATITSGEAK